MTGQEALQQLMDGNARFVAKSEHPHEALEWRQTLLQGQHPFAVVIGCSDSRVPVELIFDQGFGDLFVIRVAGNIVNDDELGSILYGVEHAGAPLVFVLGHEDCGAVTAALLTQDNRGEEPVEIQRLLSCIDPAITDIESDLDLEDQVHLGAAKNVKRMVDLLKKNSILARRLKEGSLIIQGGIYELDSGLVKLVEHGD